MTMHTSNTAAWGSQLPGDPSVPFAPLLDHAYVESVLAGSAEPLGTKVLSVEIRHVRYTPGKSCLVLYRVECLPPDSREAVVKTLYAKCYTENGYAKAARKDGGRKWLDGVVCRSPLSIPELYAVLYEFPNDARLPGLGLVEEPDKLAAIIGGRLARLVPRSWDKEPIAIDWQTLRYKPESRLVSLCESQWMNQETERQETVSFILRFDRAVDGDVVFGLMHRLHQAFGGRPGIGIPKPLFAAADIHLFAVERLCGAKLSDVLRESNAGDAVAQTARALAALHGHRDTKLPSRPRGYYLERAEKMAATLGAGGEEFVGRANEVKKALHILDGRAAPAEPGFVHGDFHQGQVLLDGDRLSIIDLDGCHNGETAADVGNLVAQLQLLQIRGRLPDGEALGETFLDVYQKSAGQVIAEERLKLWTTAALLELAAREFRRLKPNWPEAVDAILDRCLEIIKT